MQIMIVPISAGFRIPAPGVPVAWRGFCGRLWHNYLGAVYLMPDRKSQTDKLDALVAATHRSREQREQGYREQALKLYPWVCGRCAREFTRENLRELTVHHRDHNHDNNPEDGSNWELLCVYCHDNEHQRLLEATGRSETTPGTVAQQSHTHQPFAALKSLLKDK